MPETKKEYPIIHVITTIERGGAENQLLILAREQINLGFKVEIWFLKGRPELKEAFETAGAVVNGQLSGKQFILQVAYFRSYLRKIPGVHFVHAHLPQAELLAALALNRQSRFFVTRHFGGQFIPRGNPFISALLSRFAIRKAIRVIAISESVRQVIQSNHEIFKPEKVVKIFYGFDAQEFLSAVARSDSESPRKKVVIGTVARLSFEKNLKTLIQAFTLFAINQNNVELRIVGEGPLKVELQKLVIDLNIQDKVIFLGKQRDIPEVMSAFDVFVLPSLFEGFGMVLLEAMAVGRRIIVANNSAMVEVIGTSGAGMFFETLSAEDLAKRIHQILKLDLELMLKAQKQRLELFSADNMAKEVVELYESTMH